MNIQSFCDWTEECLWRAFNNKYLFGKELHDKAYMSTSLMNTTLENSLETPSTILDDKKCVLLILRIPAGTKGAFVADISGVTCEYEFLMARGQTIKIIKVLYEAGENAIILCDVLKKWV